MDAACLVNEFFRGAGLGGRHFALSGAGGVKDDCIVSLPPRRARPGDGTEGRPYRAAALHLPRGWEMWASAGGVKSKVLAGSGVGRWFL